MLEDTQLPECNPEARGSKNNQELSGRIYCKSKKHATDRRALSETGLSEIAIESLNLYHGAAGRAGVPAHRTGMQTMTSLRKPNRLASEKSPYLLQHATNPVDWYPWGEDAFSKARAGDRPIFLSIGYSTCHWCHVMEKESFENPEIAGLLNTLFVPIKVDREERPDVDRMYMAALQAMGQQGGWPMSLFLTPDLRPFYGGTYYPPENRYGRAGFPHVLRKIDEIWRSERSKVLESAGNIIAHLEEIARAGGGATVDAEAVASECLEEFAGTYDADRGGFGGAPKFPRPSVFHFLVMHHYRTGNQDAIRMTDTSLRTMARGGMYDHVGGGFHRYAVDAAWRVPHFEKMLYDQAQLVQAYLDMYQITRDPFFAGIVSETLGYVLRDLKGRDGGLFSAEDADSPRPENPEEQGEGAFYVWTRDEIVRLLHDDASLFCYHYGVEADGNVDMDPQQEFTGRNILYRANDEADTARFAGCTVDDLRPRLAACRRRLFEARLTRPRPLRDDKILTSWNGLMIGALARSASVLGNPSYLAAAVQGAEFIFSKMYDVWGGVLRRRFRDGEARHEAHLEDYAFLTAGLLSLYTASGDPAWLERAVDLTVTQNALFWDDQQGSFFDTSGRDKSVLLRMKERYDGAEPSGNAVAAENLLRLAAITGKAEWRAKAEAIFHSSAPWLERQPSVMPYMVSALCATGMPDSQLVIVGEGDQDGTVALRQEFFSRFLPTTVLLQLGNRSEQERLTRISPSVAQLSMVDGRPTAYLCENFTCRLPVTAPAELGALLDALQHPAP